MKGHYFLLIVALLLLLLVGPLFGPVAAYLVSVRDIQSAAAWEMVLFLITVSIAFGIVRIWMTRNGRTMADLGWGKPSRPLAIVLGTLLGVFWGVFGSFGYLRFVKDANIFEISLFRLLMALAGALVAFLEDVMTRGLIMNELQRLGSSNRLQVLASSVLFSLYHSIWGFNVISFIVGLIYGLMLGGLFVLGRRSLTPVILGHSLALLLGEPFLTMSLMQAIKLGR